MNIIGDGPFIDIEKIWLNELLGLTTFAVKYFDCYTISICCGLYVFSGSGMSEEQILNNFEDRTPLCGTPALIYLSFESVQLY